MFITLQKNDCVGTKTRINLDHVLYYEPTTKPYTKSVIYMTEKTLYVRESCREIDEIINKLK